jgi:dienelactone hydrolase
LRVLLPALALLGQVCLPGVAEELVHFQPYGPVEWVPERFRLDTHQFACEIKPLQSKWSRLSDVYEVTFPSPVTTKYDCNNTVHCEYFAPRGEGRHAGVVVLHILGGDFELSRLCCQSLSLHGVGALFVKMPYYGPRRPEGVSVRMVSDDLDQTLSGMTQAVLDIRRAAAWLAAREEIDANRLGITGISLGGIVGALAASAEPRFEKVCLILAGGNLEQIILESEETREIRERWAKRTFDPQTIRQQLKQVDPLTYAGNLKSRQIVMFNAKHDRVIPQACTEALWKAAGEPEIHWWNANHYSAIWYLPAALIEISQFFAEQESSRLTP